MKTTPTKKPATIRYDISKADIADFRNTTISDELYELNPDGFVADENIGDALLARYGWLATKSSAAECVRLSS